MGPDDKGRHLSVNRVEGTCVTGINEQTDAARCQSMQRFVYQARKFAITELRDIAETCKSSECLNHILSQERLYWKQCEREAGRTPGRRPRNQLSCLVSNVGDCMSDCDND